MPAALVAYDAPTRVEDAAVEIRPDMPPQLIPVSLAAGHLARASASVATRRCRSSGSARRSRSPRCPASRSCTTSSRSWLLDDEGAEVRPLAQETGYWRPGGRRHARGAAGAPDRATSRSGSARPTGAKIELQTDVVARTETSKDYTAGHRLYGLVDGDLLWAYDMAAVGQPLQPHLSAERA